MAAEILVALKKLGKPRSSQAGFPSPAPTTATAPHPHPGEPLSAKEEAFLSAHKSTSLSEFEAVEDTADVVSLPSGIAPPIC